MENKDKSAYPVSSTEHTGFDAVGDKIFTTSVDGGLTKREAFAMAAMQGLVGDWLSLETVSDKGSIVAGVETVAMMSVRMADELLKQLEQ